MCMKYSRYWGHQNWITFIGDRRTRQLFISLVGQLKSTEVNRFHLDNQKDVDPPYLNYEEKDLNVTVVCSC